MLQIVAESNQTEMDETNQAEMSESNQAERNQSLTSPVLGLLSLAEKVNEI